MSRGGFVAVTAAATAVGLAVQACGPVMTPDQIRANALQELNESTRNLKNVVDRTCRGEDSPDEDGLANGLVTCQVYFQGQESQAPTVQEYECPYRVEDLGEGCKIKQQDD